MTTPVTIHPGRKLRPSGVVAGFLLILLVCLVIFRPATTGPFVFDDFPNLGNLGQLGGHVDRASLGQYLTAFTGSPGRPLAALSFVIEDSAWPTDPAPYKRNNILWHLLCGVLVFALTRRIARATARTEPWAEVIALVTMAAWTLHPMQLSATMLVVQRMNILCSIAVLAGLLGYIRALDSEWKSQFGRVVTAGSILGLSAIVAFLCKENGVLIFAYACVLNITVLRSSVQKLDSKPRRLLLWGCAAPMIVLALVALYAGEQIIHGYANRPFTLAQRLLTEPRILLDYLQNILVPRIGGQGIFHDDYPISRGFLSPPSTALALAAVVGLIAAAWRLRARQPIFAFAVGWYFAGHLIESTVWPLELYFEHRNYLPMAGPLFALSAAAICVARHLAPLTRTLAAVWLMLAVWLTAVNAPIWGDRGALATVWLKENPSSVRAIQMMASYQADNGDYRGARETLVTGLERAPQAGELAMQVTLLDCYSGALTSAEFSRLLARARQVRFTQMLPELAGRFGREARGGRCNGTLPENGFVELTTALLENPGVQKNGRARSYIYVELSKLAVSEGNLDLTMHYLDAAYDAHKNPMVPRNQAIYLLTAGLPKEAMEYLRRSETTPMSAFDRWMLDMPALNRSLWISAHTMVQALDGPGDLGFGRGSALFKGRTLTPRPAGP